MNCDGSPTKTALLQRRTNVDTYDYWKWSFGKRPPLELYKISEDPECMNNLADNKDYVELKLSLLAQMEKELTAQGDPRILGNGHIFDDYVYAQKGTRSFYERYMNGENIKAGWVNKTDFEKEALD